MEYVFIVGIARTGSKIYSTMLNDHSDVDIVSELHYLAPRIVRRDAVTELGLVQSPLTTPEKIDAALDKMYAGTLLGDFWAKTERTEEIQHRIVDIERERLKQALANGNGGPRAVLEAVLTEHAAAAGKRRAGAKSPVDISRVATLLDWFPNSKIIHLIRDPRAIYTSMAVRDVPGADRGGFPRLHAMARRLPYITLQYHQAATLHERYEGSANYLLSRFEDMLTEPEKYMSRICDFLGLDFRPEMLQTKRIDSSYPGKAAQGMDTGAIREWETHIQSFERRYLDFALSRPMQRLGYSSTRS